MKNENFVFCKTIANGIEAIANGNVFRCPRCDETCTYTENDNGTYTTSCCGCIINYEPGHFTLYNWMDDILDIEYIVDSHKNYIGARITVACGGPNIYVNTRSGRVELYWWNERAECELSRDTVSALDEVLEEYWESI